MRIGDWVKFRAYTDVPSGCTPLLVAGEKACIIGDEGEGAWRVSAFRPSQVAAAVTELVFEEEVEVIADHLA